MSNGILISDKESRDDWMIVFDGQKGYIGKPIGLSDLQDVIKLQPAFEYVTEPFFKPIAKDQISLERRRLVLPLEHMPSLNVPVTVRKGHFYKLGDFDEFDRKILEKEIDEAYRIVRQLMQQRSGVSIESGMPPNMPPPPGRA